ncbi:MAG TPA: hypothetical protein VMN81_07605 [Vicinamibacterales bacterium]|nr:hypothetical protein [Vicinamibacterales bacterium]
MTMPAGERSSTGLDANIAAALAYLAGFITGIVLLIIEKESRFVRFHAMQSTVVFVAVLVLSVVINSIPILGAFLYAFLLFPAVVIIWLVLMFKAYNRETFKLPIAGDFAEKQI